MNVENILKVADAIEQHSISDLGFNMRDWYEEGGLNPDRSGHNCGTTACIAGWAFVVLNGHRPGPDELLRDECSELFGLSFEDGSNLFCGCPKDGLMGDVQPQYAARVLRHLAATGEVNWDLPEPAAA